VKTAGCDHNVIGIKKNSPMHGKEEKIFKNKSDRKKKITKPTLYARGSKK
jgi:hypothetical protein